MSIRSPAIMVAACLLTTGAIEAADRPTPVGTEGLKACQIQGNGFFESPGTGTCLKMAGYVRNDLSFGTVDAGYSGQRSRNSIINAVRADLTLEARSATDAGFTRAFIDLRVDYGTASTTGAGSGVNPSAANIALDTAVVEWGGLTLGHAASFYNFLQNTNINQVYEAFTDEHVNLIAFTYPIAEGIATTMSFEDSTTAGYQGTLGGLSTGRFSSVGNLANGTTAFRYGGNHAPDIVAALTLKKEWGSAKVSVVAHEDYPDTPTVRAKWGFGIQVGAKIALPALGPGDTFGVQGAYAIGANNYAYNGLYTNGDIGADAVISGGSIRQTQLSSIGAAFAHHITPEWEFDVTPAFYKVNGFGASDYSGFQLGAQLSWTPVAGLSIIPDIEYQSIAFTNATKAAYGVKSLNQLVFDLRLARAF